MLRLLPLIAPASSKITSGNAGYNPSGPLPSLPGRGDLETAEIRPIKTGLPTKADVLEIDVGQGPVIVKDFAGKAWWVRWIGRLQISREFRAYRWLEGVDGVPACLGRIDAHALALQKIEGGQLVDAPSRFDRGAAHLERLKTLVERLHGTGLVHLDLRGRENVMLGRSGDLFVLDLASAVWFRPGGLAHRLLFRKLKLTDEAALLKWKALLKAGEYTPDEQAFLKRYRFWRSLWIFNRKRPRDKKGSS